ncbi:hypothetical protein B0T18DRAFT_204586 [Schizothecium vesticola]|uniref:Uncharacterized protein n=1 Tax=Schizothecium vesticola TaxID=314040 RepID=A0AA40EIZ7_9PEZI|nr:hypothetical protein B0T18DRAFT_204586 [Schizothecium vesticola]
MLMLTWRFADMYVGVRRCGVMGKCEHQRQRQYQYQYQHQHQHQHPTSYHTHTPYQNVVPHLLLLPPRTSRSPRMAHPSPRRRPLPRPAAARPRPAHPQRPPHSRSKPLLPPPPRPPPARRPTVDELARLLQQQQLDPGRERLHRRRRRWLARGQCGDGDHEEEVCAYPDWTLESNPTEMFCAVVGDAMARRRGRSMNAAAKPWRVAEYRKARERRAATAEGGGGRRGDGRRRRRQSGCGRCRIVGGCERRIRRRRGEFGEVRIGRARGQSRSCVQCLDT